MYIAQPPLYRLKKGKTEEAYSEEELQEKIEKIGGKIDVQRYKGLGNESRTTLGYYNES